MASEKSASLTIPKIAEALAPFGRPLAESQILSIQKYVGILLIWNEKLSLTAVQDPLEIVRRHFGESISAGNLVTFSHGRLADVGSGAGFPGLALKIAFPGLETVLIEPNAKKCAFLKEVVGRLGLQSVEILRCRYEEVPAGRKFDYICSRALGNYKHLLGWSRNAIEPQGNIIFLVGQEDSIRIGNIPGWRWQIPMLVPESKKRVILVGQIS